MVLFFSIPSFIPRYIRSSVTWRLQWQMAPVEEAPRLTARPPTTMAALRPCRPAQQMMTARPIWLSTTCRRTWPRRSFVVCLAASARLNPANWFATRSQVLIAAELFVFISFEVHQIDFDNQNPPLFYHIFKSLFFSFSAVLIRDLKNLKSITAESKSSKSGAGSDPASAISILRQ